MASVLVGHTRATNVVSNNLESDVDVTRCRERAGIGRNAKEEGGGEDREDRVEDRGLKVEKMGWPPRRLGRKAR